MQFATTRERVAAVVDPDCGQAGGEREDDCDNWNKRLDEPSARGLQLGY